MLQTDRQTVFCSCTELAAIAVSQSKVVAAPLPNKTVLSLI